MYKFYFRLHGEKVMGNKSDIEVCRTFNRTIPFYQGISPVSGLVSSLKNLPVGPSRPISAYFTIRFPAIFTSPPLPKVKSVLVERGHTAFILKAVSRSW